MKALSLLACLLLAGCGTPHAYPPYPYGLPVYRDGDVSRQLRSLDWQLRMMEIDRIHGDIDRWLQHEEMMDKLDGLKP